MSDIILSLDPGSVRSGYAVMEPPEKLLEAGLLLPDKRTAASEFRIASMCRDLWGLLNKWQPGTVVIEWVSGKVNPRRHKGGGQGLQVHGAATGALWETAEQWRREHTESEVVLVPENTWTHGVPKVDRQVAVADLFPAYSIDQDCGADVADGIGLALWYLREQKLELAKATG